MSPEAFAAEASRLIAAVGRYFECPAPGGCPPCRSAARTAHDWDQIEAWSEERVSAHRSALIQWDAAHLA